MRKIGAENALQLPGLRHVLLSCSLGMEASKPSDPRASERGRPAPFAADPLLLSEAPIAIQIVAVNGEILYANAAQLRLGDWSPGDYIGRRLHAFVGDPAVSESLLAQIMHGGAPLERELVLRAKNGALRHTWVSARFRAEGDHGPARAELYSVEISARKRAEVRAAQAHSAALALAHAPSEQEAADLVVQIVATTLAAPRAGLWRLEGNSLRARSSFGYSAAGLAPYLTIPMPSALAMPVTTAVEQREAIWLESRAKLAAQFPAFDAAVQHTIADYAVACIPLLDDGRCLGVLALMFDTPREFAEEERNFTLLMTRHCASAIVRDRTRALEASITAEQALIRRRTGAFAATTRAFAEAGLSSSRLVSVAAERAAEMLGDLCLVETTEPAHDDRLLFGCGARNDVLRAALEHSLVMSPAQPDTLRLRIAQHQPRPRLLRGELLAGQRADLPEALLHLSETHPLEAVVIAPLRAHGELLGALYLARAAGTASFQLDDLELAQDMADRAALALHSASQHEQLRRERKLLDAVLHQMQSAVAVVDAENWRFILTNPQNELILGQPLPERHAHAPGDFFGFAADGRPLAREEAPVVRAVETGEAVLGQEVCIPRPDRSLVTLEVNASPVRDDDGKLLAVVANYQDISARRANEARAQFLSEATEVLSSSIDYETTLRALAKLAVPRLADWCAVEMLLPNGENAQLVVEHVDPEKVALAHELRRRYPPPPDAPAGLMQVLRSGQPELYPEIPDALLAAQARDAEHLEMARSVGLKSALVVAIRAKGQIYGALTLASAESGRRFDREDLQLAERLAERAATAIEHALLYQRAQLALRRRDDFLSVASHELKTPLTSLELHLSSLLHLIEKRAEPLPPEKLKTRLTKAHLQVGRLTDLINDLLDVSRVASGRLSLRRERVDLAVLAREVSERFEHEARRAGTRFLLEGAPAVGRWDASRLDQLLTNLLSNAVKYGAGQPIAVAVATRDQYAMISVRDRGMGIASEDLLRIFEQFERSDAARNYAGLGLGLWIVRQIAEAHGGRVEVESELGRGSTFTVRLPLNAEEKD